VGAVVAVPLLLVPRLTDPYTLHIIILFLLYAYLSQCWNILGGYAGQLSLGHSVFLGTGAYTTALLFTRLHVTPWLGMLAGMAVATLLAFVIGSLCFRYGLKGPYFALATLALAEVARLIATNLTVTGGANGLSIPLHTGSIAAFQFSSKTGYYYAVLAMVVLSTLVVLLMSKDRLGYFLRAIREDEVAAQAIGVDPMRNKLIATCISAAMTALGGAFYAQYILFLAPNEVLGSSISITLAMNAVIGGKGTVLGPLLGAAFTTPLAELTRSMVSTAGTGVHMIAYSLVLIAACLLFPNGFVPLLARIIRRRRPKGASS
jgi:branched-chain amino acid transport system permease protein